MSNSYVINPRKSHRFHKRIRAVHKFMDNANFNVVLSVNIDEIFI